MPAKFENIEVTPEFLNSRGDIYYVYGDNGSKQGSTDTAKLRGHPRAIGFIVRKAPDDAAKSCFTPEEYVKPFFDQLKQLSTHIVNNKQQTFYVSKLGFGSANKHYIWERLVYHNLVSALGVYDNVVFCWEQEKLASN